MTLKTYMVQNGLQALYRNIEDRLDEREVNLRKSIMDDIPESTVIVKEELKDEIKQEILDELSPGSGGSTDVERVSDDDIDNLFV